MHRVRVGHGQDRVNERHEQGIARDGQGKQDTCTG
jgi:hypothetical protein